MLNYSELGLIGLIGDWNSRVGTQLDYIESDKITNVLHRTLDDIFSYDSDSEMPVRLTENCNR